ncbi:MAG: DUF4412 domain-containing protein [Bacteroidetes bacterium]|nr:DUF4412 domain-containing protein [Bacteroidota bacterium]HET6242923.1 DUF4412 domain-containing protein [Bacteroidia bacterium]
MKLQIIILLAYFSTQMSFAQSFEGLIESRKISPIDTVHFIFYIKEDKIRIDQIGYDKKIEEITLVNLSDFKSKSLNPIRMLLTDIESAPTKEFVKIQNVSVSKGKKIKTIAGYQCQEWVVVKKEQNIQITYFLAKDNFFFFEKMLISLNRKDKLSTFYQQLPETTNAFPFYAIEADLKGKPTNIFEVTGITKKSLDHSLFHIPEGYKRFGK